MDVAEDGNLLAHGGKNIVNGQFHTQAVMEECLVKTQVELPRLGQVDILRIPGRAPRQIGIQPDILGQVDSIVKADSPKYFTSKSCHIMASINWG